MVSGLLGNRDVISRACGVCEASDSNDIHFIATIPGLFCPPVIGSYYYLQLELLLHCIL